MPFAFELSVAKKHPGGSLFHVTIGETVTEFDKRKAAIDAARAASDEQSMPVTVEDAAGTEQLTYRSGKLEKYQYDTRQAEKVRAEAN